MAASNHILAVASELACKNTASLPYLEPTSASVPPTWGTSLSLCRYNLVVIGAGAGGLVTAAGAAGVGARVAIVEEHLMGGDCLNVGCVPSKALIRCARAAHEVNLPQHACTLCC